MDVVSIALAMWLYATIMLFVFGVHVYHTGRMKFQMPFVVVSQTEGKKTRLQKKYELRRLKRNISAIKRDEILAKKRHEAAVQKIRLDSSVAVANSNAKVAKFELNAACDRESEAIYDLARMELEKKMEDFEPPIKSRRMRISKADELEDAEIQMKIAQCNEKRALYESNTVYLENKKLEHELKREQISEVKRKQTPHEEHVESQTKLEEKQKHYVVPILSSWICGHCGTVWKKEPNQEELLKFECSHDELRKSVARRGLIVTSFIWFVWHGCVPSALIVRKQILVSDMPDEIKKTVREYSEYFHYSGCDDIKEWCCYLEGIIISYMKDP